LVNSNFNFKGEQLAVKMVEPNESTKACATGKEQEASFSMKRVFDPFDERWVFIDELTPDCLSSHENLRIIKNEGGEKE